MEICAEFYQHEWNYRFSSLKRSHTIPSSKQKLCFLAFQGHSPGGALRAIQPHISIATIILAFYRVRKNKMGFYNHITVLNTSPQNESTKNKRGVFFASFPSQFRVCPHLWVAFVFSLSSICCMWSNIGHFYGFIWIPSLPVVIGKGYLQLINKNMPIDFIDIAFTV